MQAAEFPIFVISFNRADFLSRCVASYRALTTPVEIVIHDFGSDDAATLALLDQLEVDGTRIVRAGKIRYADDLNAIDETVRAYFSNRHSTGRYVVTDCDIDMSIADPGSLRVYDALLDRFSDAACVGPMLRIADIPTSYPLYNRAINRHVDHFWRHKPHFIELDGRHVAYLPAAIDTTFSLHRGGEPFRRKKQGLRVYHPFEARHLDWYCDADDFLRTGYARTSSARISHWNNADQLGLFGQEPLKFDAFTYVDTADGRLVCKSLSLPRDQDQTY